MSQKEIFNLISQMTGQANILTLPLVLIDFCDGDHATALILSQLLYWNGKSKNEWIYKTYDSWYKELRLSEYQVRRARKNLEKMGILETKVKKANGNPTLHYRIKTKEFLNLLMNKLNNQNFKKPTNQVSLKTSESLTETTTEITPKTTTLYNNSKNLNDENLEDLAQQIYQAYPSKCPVNGRPTHKTNKDKLKIKRILATGYPLLRIVTLYVEYCKSKGFYLKNLSTFLNNLPNSSEAEKMFHIETDEEMLQRIISQNNLEE